MNKLVILALAIFAPAIALADKDYDGGSGGTYDCAADPVVNVNHGSGTYVFTGECREINLNGSNLEVRIESVDQLAINGATNSVKVSEVQMILINGDKNSVRWRKAKTGRRPTVANNGEGNSVAKLK